jgi:cytoskeleton protein RodZ
MNEGAVPADGVTAGMLLRRAREAAGLHAETLAANLKVPVRKLEALEEDRYDLLPDAVFVRALASSVCRTLKLDAKPVLSRLPQTTQPRLVPDTEGINAPFHAPGDGPGPRLVDQMSRPVVLTVGALLVGALVLVFLPYVQSGIEAVSQANRGDPVMPPPGAAATVPSSPVAVETASAPSAGAPLEPASASGAVPTAAALTQLPDPAGGTVASPATAAAQASTAAGPGTPLPAASSIPITVGQVPVTAANNGSGIVAFRTKGQSWVQVSDGSGATVFRKLMESGETAGVNGSLPLSVVIGSVQATEVQVRGKPYNLAPVSKDNVARFQVK